MSEPEEIGRVRAVLPEALRERLERELLRVRNVGRAAERMARVHGLEARYGIGGAALRAYGMRLRWMARQRAAGVIAAPLSGGDARADASKARSSARAMRMLLVQRLIENLQHGELSTLELARMAQAMAAMQRVGAGAGKRTERGGRERGRKRLKPLTPDVLGEIVREVYGVRLGRGAASGPRIGAGAGDCD